MGIPDHAGCQELNFSVEAFPGFLDEAIEALSAS
jgi:hypothetical protein